MRPFVLMMVIACSTVACAADPKIGELEEPDNAISDHTQAIRLAPHETTNYVRRANAWFSVAIKHQFGPPIQSGGIEIDIQIPPEKEIALAHAMVDCCDAIQIDPRCADAYLCRAHLWSFKEQWKSALSDFRQAVMLDPGSPRANVELARFLIAHPFPALLTSSEAIRCATTACELTDWESFGEVDTLVRACVASGAPEAATKWSEKAIALLPPARQQFMRDEYRKLLDREPASASFRILQIQE